MSAFAISMICVGAVVVATVVAYIIYKSKDKK